ncbi:hypothetical protein [Phocaeicola dorei]|uniref:hypothetical protein n=1 Tax=Phocaeicola dorei TaxID=357276 RepID=UPI0034A58B9F
MECIILIALGDFLLKFFRKLLRKICSTETTSLWLVVLFRWLILGWFWIGTILLTWWCVLMPITRYQECHPKRYKRYVKEGKSLNRAIM